MLWNSARSSVIDEHIVPEIRTMWKVFGVFGMILLVMDCVALGWLGFWQSLFSKTPHQAARTAMFGIVWLPLILFCLGMAALLPWAGELERPAFALLLWFLVGLLADTAFIAIVRRRFRLNLRYMISERAAARPLRA
jgi:hypothetical protein